MHARPTKVLKTSSAQIVCKLETERGGELIRCEVQCQHAGCPHRWIHGRGNPHNRVIALAVRSFAD